MDVVELPTCTVTSFWNIHLPWISVMIISTLPKEGKLIFSERDNNPEEKKEILSKYSFSANDVVYIGDAPNDWDAAKQAGVKPQ